MKTMAVYNNKAFEIIGNYSIETSNREVAFSDLSIDFTGKGLADIPYKYQEIKIKEAEDEQHILRGKTLFSGFLDEISLSSMKYQGEDRVLKLTLLSPLAMSTRRTVTLIGTNRLKVAITRILQPLIDDGFRIEEMNIPNGRITTNFVLETVENCMNTICYKRGIFWHIDENKCIYVNSIDYLFGLDAKKEIVSGITDMEEEGIYNIQPTIKNVNYANVLNFKNVRVFTKSFGYGYNQKSSYELAKPNRRVKQGDYVEFNYPIIIDEKTANMLSEERGDNIVKLFQLGLGNKYDTAPQESFYILLQNGEYSISSEISFNDQDYEDSEKIILQKDEFFKNMITGFYYNGSHTWYINEIISDSALRYTTMKYMYSQEIEKMKGIISDSGQIERTIDYNEQWTTEKQLIEYARSLIIDNSNIINTVDLSFDKNPDLRLGDIIQINTPEFYIDGNFAVTDIKYNYINDENQTWNITVKNADFVSTYIDLFRPLEQQQDENNINTMILSEFIEENIKETHTTEREV